MAVLNAYNYSKPKNFVNVNIGNINAAPPAVAVPAKSREQDKADQYLEQRVLSAKPEELTFMLYEGLVRFIKKAIIAVDANDAEKAHNNCVRALNIISELRSTLNLEVEMSGGLDSLYEYMEFKLFDADVDKSREAFEDVLAIATEFKDTWKSAFGL